ncbi:MAG: acetate--CoA ligase family protein [Acidimicrobiales bacterium]
MPSGLEVICGLHRDEVFGPVLLVGVGGATAEALGFVRRALGPLDEERAAS